MGHKTTEDAGRDELDKALSRLRAQHRLWHDEFLESSLPEGLESTEAEPLATLEAGLLAGSATLSKILEAGAGPRLSPIAARRSSRGVLQIDPRERAAMLAVLGQLLSGILIARLGQIPLGEANDPGTPAQKQERFKKAADAAVRSVQQLIHLSMLSLIYAAGAAAGAGKFGESLTDIEKAVQSFLNANALLGGVRNRLKTPGNYDTPGERRGLRRFLEASITGTLGDLGHVKTTLGRLRSVEQDF